MACIDRDVAIAVGSVIHRSDDQGETWEIVFSDTDEVFNRVVFADARHGVAVADVGIIAETLDGGLTWSHDLLANKNLLSVAFRDGRSAVAVGESGTLLLGVE